jgi:hypothetical protein
MNISRSLSALVAVTAVTAVAGMSAPLGAQAFDVSPTYQASVARLLTEAPQSQFQAVGVMLGFQNTGSWSPHVWVQRYRLESDCQFYLPAQEDCRTEGWSVSIGPALQFLDTDRWTGTMVTQVGLDSRSTQDVTGGAGLHMGVKLGAFQPHAFSRLDVFRGTGYMMVGVGLRFRFSNGPTRPDPYWGG